MPSAPSRGCAAHDSPPGDQEPVGDPRLSPGPLVIWAGENQMVPRPLPTWIPYRARPPGTFTVNVKASTHWAYCAGVT